jgi:cyclopropane fatty-acyl-phospholipid synthase-like methyltransferase
MKDKYYDFFMDDPVNITINTYNKYASDFKKRSQNEDVTTLKLIKKLKKYDTGSNLLDIGCGTGRDSLILSNEGFDIIAIDLSEEMLKIAKEIAPKVTFLKMDIRNMSFKKRSFDCIWSLAALLHIPKENIENVFCRISEIIKISGLFVFSLKLGEGEKYVENKGDNNLDGARRFFAYYSEEELKEILKKFKFEVLEVEKNETRGNKWISFITKKL